MALLALLPLLPALLASCAGAVAVADWDVVPALSMANGSVFKDFVAIGAWAPLVPAGGGAVRVRALGASAGFNSSLFNSSAVGGARLSLRLVPSTVETGESTLGIGSFPLLALADSKDALALVPPGPFEPVVYNVSLVAASGLKAAVAHNVSRSVRIAGRCQSASSATAFVLVLAPPSSDCSVNGSLSVANKTVTLNLTCPRCVGDPSVSAQLSERLEGLGLHAPAHLARMQFYNDTVVLVLPVLFRVSGPNATAGGVVPVVLGPLRTAVAGAPLLAQAVLEGGARWAYRCARCEATVSASRNNVCALLDADPDSVQLGNLSEAFGLKPGLKSERAAMFDCVSRRGESLGDPGRDQFRRLIGPVLKGFQLSEMLKMAKNFGENFTNMAKKCNKVAEQPTSGSSTTSISNDAQCKCNRTAEQPTSGSSTTSMLSDEQDDAALLVFLAQTVVLELRAVVTSATRTCLLFWQATAPVCFGYSATGAGGRGQLAVGFVSPLPRFNYSVLDLGRDEATHLCGLTGNGTLFCNGASPYLKANPPGRGGSRQHPTSTCYPSDDALEAKGALWMPLSVHTTCVNPEPAYRALSVGYEHSCAVASRGGALTCWGRHAYGKLGPCKMTRLTDALNYSQIPDALKLLRNPPVACVEFAGPALEVGAGASFSCARWHNGTVTCWGLDSHQQVSGAPPPGEPMLALAVGAHHACAVDAAGRLRCWGADTNGETAAPRDDGYFEVAVAEDYSCAKRRSARANVSEPDPDRAADWQVQLVCWAADWEQGGGAWLPHGPPRERQGVPSWRASQLPAVQPFFLAVARGKSAAPLAHWCKPEPDLQLPWLADQALAPNASTGTAELCALFGTANGTCQSLLQGTLPGADAPAAFDGTAWGMPFLSCAQSALIVDDTAQRMRCADFGVAHYQIAVASDSFDRMEILFYILLSAAAALVLAKDNGMLDDVDRQPYGRRHDAHTS